MHYTSCVTDHRAHEGLLRPLGGRVKALRAARGMTLRELASRASLSSRFLAQLEAGEGNISVARLAEVAEALGSTVAALLDGLHVHRSKRPAVVALLGVRGAGKTTIGRRLGRRLSIPFQELDALVEQEAGLTLREIFDLHGEAYYRRVERRALARFLDAHPPGTPGAVLAVGGGLVTDATSFHMLRSRALTVWLKATAKDHWNRVVAQGDRRPMAENPRAFSELRALLEARRPLYAESAFTTDTSALGLADATAAILDRLEG